MKLFIFSFILFSTTSFSKNFECYSNRGRSFGSSLVVAGKLLISVETIDSIMGSGQIELDNRFDYNRENNFCYKAEFSNVSAKRDPDYRPTRYQDHNKYNDFDATKTSTCDGGGMYGHLIFPERISRIPLTMYYVFEAGDHLGGTLEFNCYPRD